MRVLEIPCPVVAAAAASCPASCPAKLAEAKIPRLKTSVQTGLVQLRVPALALEPGRSCRKSHLPQTVPGGLGLAVRSVRMWNQMHQIGRLVVVFVASAAAAAQQQAQQIDQTLDLRTVERVQAL